MIPIKTFQLLILDCDGVMFDTSEANRTYYNRLLKAAGLADMTDEQFAYSHMHTVFESVDYLFKTPKLIEKAHQIRSRLNYASVIPDMQIEPSLKAVLKAVRPAVKTAVATNRTDTMDAVLDYHGLTDLFDLVVTAQDVQRPKPHPDMLEKAIGYFDLDRQQAVFVGDSPVDQQAAGAAGMTFVAIGNNALPADVHIRQLDELLPFMLPR